MANKNLTDALFEKKGNRQKFSQLFIELVHVGEKLIALLRTSEPKLFEAIRVPADELIERWESILQQIVFLAFSKKQRSKKKV